MSFLELIQKRKSVRQFLPQAPNAEVVAQFIQVALLAPSGKQKNHWDFICVQNKDMLTSLGKCKTHGAAMIERAPLAIVVIGDPTMSDTWIEDCSIASIYLQLAATDLGLGSCWVQIDKREFNATISADSYIKQLLDIPEHKKVLSILAIGYPDSEKKPATRQRDYSNQVHYEKF